MIEPALTQLLSVGVVWISFHCIGMCGPIVGGVVGGAFDAIVCRAVGRTAKTLFRRPPENAGPPESKKIKLAYLIHE